MFSVSNILERVNEMLNNNNVSECIGKSMLWLSRFVGIYLLIKAVAPNGLIN